MKLLFDENLSYKLVHRLSDIFADSRHVKDVQLENENDLKIWEFAKSHNFAIVTKDSDFVDFINIKGYPPYLIWIRSNNVRVKEVEKIIRDNAIRILNSFEAQKIGIIQIK